MAGSNTPPREFVRPAKSPARRTGGSGGESIEASVRQMAGQAYASVPDMGVQSTLQRAYQQAPDMGIQSTIAKATGYGAAASSTTEEEQDRNEPATSSTKRDTPTHDSSLSPSEVSRRAGPSSPSRVGKSQREIGTEHTVPTRAGYGTTLSPDKTNANAAASSSHRPKQARVPQDYAPEPLPLSVGQAHYRKRSDDRAVAATATTGTSSPRSNASSNERKRRSFGEKLRDQVRGELKILAGSLTNNDKTIVQGLNIKHGEVA